jgi:tetratricopeptide (TPR) repeat protein
LARLDFAEAGRLLARRADSLRGMGVPDDDPRWITQQLLTADVASVRGTLAPLRVPLRRAASQAEEQGLHALHARALLRLADLAQTEGAHEEADTLLRRAAAAYKEADDPDRWAGVRHQMGTNALARGDIEGAAMHLERGLRRATSPGRQALLRVGLAWVHAWREADDEAARTLRAELAEAERGGHTRLRSECHAGLGLLAVRSGRLDEASAHYEQALRATPAAAASWRHSIELDRCLVHLARGELLQTAQEAERIIAGSEDTLPPQLECWARVLSGPARVVEEEGTRWLEAVERSLRSSMRVTPDLAGVLEITARCAEQAGLPHRARRVWALAETQWRTLGNRERARTARERARAR